MEYRKNDLIRVKIEDISSDGQGIGKAEGFTLFVKDAVIGDIVEAKIVKSKKHYAYARLEKVVTPSPFRVEPECVCHRQCGGCQLQTLSYEKQLEFKQRKIRNNLIRIGGFSPENVDAWMEPIVGMENPFHYRNKAQYPVGYDRSGNLITGFYAGRTHNIITNMDCALGAPQNAQILEIILEYMKENHVTAYDEKTETGLVRHVLIRTGFASGEIMVCLVLNAQESVQYAEEKGSKNNMTNMSCEVSEGAKEWKSFLPNQEKLLEKLAEIDGMTSVSVNRNTEKTNVIMGKEVYTIWGKAAISDTIHMRDMEQEGYPCTGRELTFKISPLSFYQVNPVQTEKLYSLALEYAGLTGKETVWDLYCGIGTISLFLAGQAKQVYGVEVIPQAIEDARSNADRNGITNAEFFVGKAEEVLPNFYRQISCQKAGNVEKEKELSEPGDTVLAAGSDSTEAAAEDRKGYMLHPDVIVVDPPRKGCDELCLETMLQMSPERIVYVSCDSATLARDLRVLCDGGYEIKRVRGVDQFGMTVHVETVVKLVRKTPDAYIDITVDMDELDLTASEAKATYQKIKDYIKEKYDIKVSSLYIAQVKQKHGIIERENYNTAKSENAKQPQCPPEKEKLIEEALRYFKMIS